jgi:lysophospholipase L1-like esterase
MRPKHVFVGTLLPNTPTGFAAFPPSYDKASNTAVSLYNQAIGEVVRSFSKFSVHYVDTHKAFVGANLTSQGADALMQDDEVHPNEQGLKRIADTFEMVIREKLDLKP